MNLGIPEKHEIDGVEFQIYPFSAIEALKLKAAFIKLIAPAFGQLVGDSEMGEGSVRLENVKLEGKALSSALQMLCESLSEDEFEKLIRRFTRKVSCIYTDIDGKQKSGELQTDQVFNTVFTKRLSLIYKLIGKVIQVNYPDFFGLIGGIGSRLKTVIGN